MKKRLAIFASGGGSNARKILEHFEKHEKAEVALIVSNRKEAGVLAIADEFGVEKAVISKAAFFNETDQFVAFLNEKRIDFIALAGFLWLVPPALVRAFEGKMLNVHPALLPKFGGKGMFGHHVHEAVKAAGETSSGPTIHFVNEHFDEGAILFQAKTRIEKTDAADDIARKVLALEHRFFARVIEQAMLG